MATENSLTLSMLGKPDQVWVLCDKISDQECPVKLYPLKTMRQYHPKFTAFVEASKEISTSVMKIPRKLALPGCNGGNYYLLSVAEQGKFDFNF